MGAGHALRVAVRDVQCDDEMVNEFNAFFRMAGRYRIAPDYALGDSDEQKSQLFVSYMTSNMTADEYETNYERITRNAIAASGKIKIRNILPPAGKDAF